MYKIGLILLVFIIFLESGYAQQDSCLAVPQNPSEEQLNQLITEAAARIWNTYSQIPKYSGDNNAILKAALEGLNTWEPEPQYAILADYKERIADEMKRLAEVSGSCIDDYSLNSKDDCWNQDALCVENRCVKFEDMGWSEENLDRARKLRQGVYYEILSYEYRFTSEKLRPIFPVIAKYLEGANAGRFMDESQYDLIIRLQAIDRLGSVDALLGIYAESQNFGMRKEARKQLIGMLHEVSRFYIEGDYDRDQIESLGYFKIMEGLGIKKTIKDECQQNCWLQDALCVEGECKEFNEFNWDSNSMNNLRMFKSSNSEDRLEAIARFGNLNLGSEDLKIQILDSILMTENNQYVIFNTMAAINSFRSADSTNILIRILKLGNPYARAQAAYFLENTNHDMVTPHLIETIQMDDDEDVKINAVNSLRYILSGPFLSETYKQEIIDLLISLLADAEGNFRGSIINTLGELVQEDSLLQRFETEQNLNIRKGIVDVLGEKTSIEANNALIRIFETDQSKDMRAKAGIALANAASLETVPILLGRLDLVGFENRDIYTFIIDNIINNEEISSSDQIYTLLLSYLRQNVHLLKSRAIEGEARLMLSIYRKLDEKDRNELEFSEDYFISFVPQLNPNEVLKIMRKNPVFERIYSNQKLSSFSPVEKNSISISVYRYLSRDRNRPTNVEIENAIDFIIVKRGIFEKEVILGEDKYLIVFNHEDYRMKAEPIKEFARKRGVTRFPTFPAIGLKGATSKQDIIDTIVTSKEQGKTVIWADAHGLPNYICLGGGVPNQEGNIDEEFCLGFKYDEFTDILLQRGSLNEVILIIDSCFSYNFAEQLLEDLSRKNSLSYPTIITETNKGKFGYVAQFQSSLNSLNLVDNEPLLGSHIYEAEQYSFDKQDSAVFFSEDGISPSIEIAMDSLDPSQCGCSGPSCPIQPVQGISS